MITTNFSTHFEVYFNKNSEQYNEHNPFYVLTEYVKSVRFDENYIEIEFNEFPTFDGTVYQKPIDLLDKVKDITIVSLDRFGTIVSTHFFHHVTLCDNNSELSDNSMKYDYSSDNKTIEVYKFKY